MALAGPLQAFMFAVMVRTRQSQLTYVDARVRLKGRSRSKNIQRLLHLVTA